MVRESLEFETEDNEQRKRVETLNSFSTFVFGLKAQLEDKKGLGGKVGSEEAKTLREATKEAVDWLDGKGGHSASTDEIAQKLDGKDAVSLGLKVLLVILTSNTELQKLVNPITAKLYSEKGEEYIHDHNEL